jgi:IMP dehydrogenase/GMP reductase
MVDRLDVEDADTVDVDTLGAEGLEVSVPLRGSARPIIAGMLKHLSSSISYGGAASLAELKTMFWERPEEYIIKLSESSKRESFER